MNVQEEVACIIEFMTNKQIGRCGENKNPI